MARFIVAAWLLLFLFAWAETPFSVLPTPAEVGMAWVRLWQYEGLGAELLTSFVLNLQALAYSTILSLGLAYLTVVPVVRPLVMVLSKFRFLSLAGLTFVFTLTTHGGHELKLSLLVFSVTVFFVTGMVDVVAQTPKEKFDLARTLRMGEWRVVWEVVILGRADAAWEMLRQNAAMGWMMLTTVEGLVRSEGGVGGLLLNQNKHFRLDAVFAIQLTVLAIGLGQDYALSALKRLTCPYAELTLERRG